LDLNFVTLLKNKIKFGYQIYAFMKYLFLLFPIFSFSQNIYIPDPVLKNYLIAPVIGYHLDTNGDGEINKQEALALTNFSTFLGIGIGGVGNVADFTGLEHFTNLQTIYILENQAVSLNLDNLIHLKELWISGSNTGGTLNPITFSPIVNLTVNGCTALENISIGLSNIQNLDLTTNTALKKFYATESKLETVNFTGLALLERVEILNGGYDHFTFYGLLQNVTLGGNTALNFVEIKNQPNLLILDFTGAPNLSYLYCTYSGLTSLHIQNVSNLEYADCSNNHITALDLSGLTNLETLHCEYNQIDRLDFTGANKLVLAYCNNNLIEEVIVSPDVNTHLVYVDCSFNQLRTLNFENLGNEFKSLACQNNLLEEVNVKGTDLRGINCSNNNLKILDFEWLQNLEGIDCRNNQISSINMKHVINNPYDGLSTGSMYFENNPLLYACVDDFQIDHYKNYFSAKGMNGVDVSSTCEFESTIFPNPVGTTLNIRSGSKINSFNIYDMNGRLVLSNTVNAYSSTNAVSELQTGIYVLEVISNNISKMSKIIKN
jgi:hypothetical protein